MFTRYSLGKVVGTTNYSNECGKIGNIFARVKNGPHEWVYRFYYPLKKKKKIDQL